MHREITQLIYYSNGGYTWNELYYEIPVWMRKLYIRQIQEILDKESEKATNGNPKNEFNILNSNLSNDVLKKGDPNDVTNDHLSGRHRASTKKTRSNKTTKSDDLSFELPESAIKKIREMGDE